MISTFLKLAGIMAALVALSLAIWLVIMFIVVSLNTGETTTVRLDDVGCVVEQTKDAWGRVIEVQRVCPE